MSPSALPDDVESPLKSLVTPSYASCITENAAEAFDENFPQTDLTPLPPKRSGFGTVRVRFGDVEWEDPEDEGLIGFPGGCNEADECSDPKESSGLSDRSGDEPQSPLEVLV